VALETFTDGPHKKEIPMSEPIVTLLAHRSEPTRCASHPILSRASARVRARGLASTGVAVLAVLTVTLVVGLLPAGSAFGQDHPRSPSQAQPELDRIGRAIVHEGCRKPLSFKRERVVSPRGGLDAVYNTECPGFSFATFAPRVGPASRAKPMELTVSATHARVPADIGVGATADSVRSKLGLPFETRGERLIYSLVPQRPEEDSLTFDIQGGVVKALVWSW
jgi:hypothetical protein